MTAKQALAIGINAYLPSRLYLSPCINDATDLTTSLRSIGFHAQCATDLSLNSMKSVTHRFVESIRPGAIVLFYFSGHGVQHAGTNYLIPSNIYGISSENISSTAIDAQQLIFDMHRKRPRVIICILDCCRTLPPAEPLDAARPISRVLAGTRPGFAPMQAPSSTIIAYACAADDTASADSKHGRNSLYTAHLLRYIKTPDADIENVLRYVAAEVQKESKNEQIPFRYSSCNESISLASSQMYNVPTLLQQAQMGVDFLPFNKHPHGKGHRAHHAQPRSHNFEQRLNGHFGIPVNHRVNNRHVPTDARRPPLGFGLPVRRGLHHHRS